MAKRTDIHKVLIIGSGPIIIGQACEFDYSGTQACKALRSLGYEIVLVNSNPATIMTDPEMADVTYIEPLNAERLEQIIAKERPDALLPNLGGQSGLNLCAELNKKGILDKYDVKVIGVQVDAIERGEDRVEFKQTMESLGIGMARSEVSYSVDEALKIADEVLQQAVQGITDLINLPALINLDFADVKAIMYDTGMAHMGIGRASGENRAEEAAKAAINSPLLESSIEGARGVLLNITGGTDLGIFEINTAAELVQKSIDPEANIIFGAAIDETMGDEISVTVIATGFDKDRIPQSSVDRILKGSNVVAQPKTNRFRDNYGNSDKDNLEVPYFLRNSGAKKIDYHE